MINISIKKPKPVLVMVHNASKGLRGVGLSGVTLDKNGNLIFTMSDGTVKTIKGYSQNLINTTNAVNKIKEEVSTMANNAADSAKEAKETADSIKQEYDRVEGATNSGLALIERSVLYGINRVKEATKTCKSDALANIELAHKDAIDDIAIRRLEALQDISETLGGQLAYFNEVSVDNDTLTFRRGSGDTHRLTIDYVQHAHNASSATKLQTARTINVTDANGTNTGTGASFNGTNNATIKLPNNIGLYGLTFPNVDGGIRPTGPDGQKAFTILADTNNPFNYSRIRFSSKTNGNGDGYIYITSNNGKDSSELSLTPTGASYNKTLKTTIDGNASSATKLANARTINVQDASASNTGTGASFDGSGNATIKLPAKIKATLNGNADTATKTTATSTEDKSVLELVKGMTNNDWGAIRAGSTASNAGYLEISTGDDGNEPIYARQISAASGKEVVTHEATLLDASGNTKFPGTVTAASFDGNTIDLSTLNFPSSGGQIRKTGDADAKSLTIFSQAGTFRKPLIGLDPVNNTIDIQPGDGTTSKRYRFSMNGAEFSITGNAATATKATNDGNGNNIASTYLPLSGGTVTGGLTVKGTITGNVTGDLTGTASGNLPLSGGTMTGNVTWNMTDTRLKKSNENGAMSLYGGTSWNTSPSLSLYGIGNSNSPGCFDLSAHDGTTRKQLIGRPDGTLTWEGQPLLPVGIVQAFAGTTIPSGWLLCDGSAVSRTTYAKLFAVIGTSYGAGDGTDTFNLPNLIDKFVEGSATAGTVKSAGLPNITGAISPFEIINGAQDAPVRSQSGALTNRNHTNNRNTASQSGTNNNDGSGFDLGIAFNASLSNPIYGKSTTVQPPALTMRYIIKY